MPAADQGLGGREQRARRPEQELLGKEVRRGALPRELRSEPAGARWIPERDRAGRVLPTDILGPPSDRLRRQTVAVRRDVLRTCVQRAQADRLRLRVRAGDAASRAASERSGAGEPLTSRSFEDCATTPRVAPLVHTRGG